MGETFLWSSKWLLLDWRSHWWTDEQNQLFGICLSGWFNMHLTTHLSTFTCDGFRLIYSIFSHGNHRIQLRRKLRKGHLLVWNQCEYSCEGLLWCDLSTLFPPGGFPESLRHRCHEEARRLSHQGCVPDRSRSPTTVDFEEEGSHLHN